MKTWRLEPAPRRPWRDAAWLIGMALLVAWAAARL